MRTALVERYFQGNTEVVAEENVFVPVCAPQFYIGDIRKYYTRS